MDSSSVLQDKILASPCFAAAPIPQSGVSRAPRRKGKITMSSSLRVPAATGALFRQDRRFLPASQSAQPRLAGGPARVRGVAGKELSANQSRQPRESHIIASASLRFTEAEAELSMDPTLISVPPPAHPTYDIAQTVKQALEEDFGSHGDITSVATIPEATQAEAQFLAKAEGVLAGVAVADAVFRHVDPTLRVSWSARDGDTITKGTIFGTVQGSARSILAAERVALNFMQRMSGIATATKIMADAARPATLLETRKTVPGLRLLDKWAVLIGGGRNHRMGLYDMLMIKDNHIAAAGGIPQAVEAAAQYLREQGLDLEVEVEARTLEEVEQVLACRGEGPGRVTRVMLDNMTTVRGDGTLDVSLLRQAVQMVDGRLETEASGNVTVETVHEIGGTGVTFISSGALTHSVKALDISLNIDTQLALEVGKRTNRS